MQDTSKDQTDDDNGIESDIVAAVDTIVSDLRARHASLYASGGGTIGALIIDGSMYAPSARAVPGMETIYQSGDIDAWEYAEGRLDELTDELEMFWEDGALFLVDECADDGNTCGHWSVS